MKKFISMLLAVIITLSMLTVGAVGVSAAETTNKTVSDTSCTFNFDVNSCGWSTAKFIYCHIYRVDGTGSWPLWQSKAEKCTYDTSTKIATYDLATAQKRDYEMNIPATNSCAIIFSSDTGMETYPIFVNSSCNGDTVYAPDKTKYYENGFDVEKRAQMVKWKNHDLGAPKTITSTGKIQGESFAEGDSNVTVMADYMIAYYQQKRQMSFVGSLLSSLNIGPEETMEAVAAKEFAAVRAGNKKQAEAESEINAIRTILARYVIFPAPELTSIKLNRPTLSLGVGEYYTLIKKANYIISERGEIVSSYTSSKVKGCVWESSDMSVADVDGNGKVTALSAGMAIIKVTTLNGYTDSCLVTVKNAPSDASLSENNITLGKGEKFTISESTNSGSYAWGFNWSSSNSNVVSVARSNSNKAVITAKNNGTATITFKTYNGVAASCKVTVKNAPSSVALNYKNLTIGAGETFVVSGITNSNSYSKSFSWSSNNSRVATVVGAGANKGKITAKNTGTATITIKTYNGKTSSLKLTVKKAPSSVRFSATNITLGKGESYTVSGITNSGSYTKTFSWSSSNSNVAVVASAGANKGKIAAKNTGTAVITIKTQNGKTASCKVTVKDAPSNISLSDTNIYLFPGESYNIYESTNSGSYSKYIKWSSSNTKTATVAWAGGNKGKITAKAAGSATITVKTFNGKTSTCKVTVLSKTASSNSYQSIYYSAKLQNTTPTLIKQFYDYTNKYPCSSEKLAGIAQQKIVVLANIANEGIEKMAEIENKKGDYDNYQSWSIKLLNVYENETKKICDAYVNVLES